MARQTRKKTAEAPKAEMGAEIFASLRELEKLKGIPVDYMVERLKQALANAYRKDREDHRDIPAENVVVDVSETGIAMHLVKTAVEEVEDTAIQIHIEAARKIDPTVQPGESVVIPVDIQKLAALPLRPPSRWSSRASVRLSVAWSTKATPPRRRSC